MLLIFNELNPEIINHIEKGTPLGKRFLEIFSIIPDGVTFEEYAEKAWDCYLKNSKTINI